MLFLFIQFDNHPYASAHNCKCTDDRSTYFFPTINVIVWKHEVIIFILKVKNWCIVSRRYINLCEGDSYINSSHYSVLYIYVFGGGSACQESRGKYLCTFAVFPVFIRSQGNPTSHSSYNDLWCVLFPS